MAAETITIAIRKHGATAANDWTTNRQGATDVVASYAAQGREPDKQWITIDLNPASPHFDRVYAMWTLFDSYSAVPWMSYADARADGTHTAWSAPQQLPTAGSNPQGDTYLLPHVDGAGNVYTTVTNFEPKQGYCCTNIILDKSTDGGVTWKSVSNVITNVVTPPLTYPNTTFRDGIEDTFAVGPGRLANGSYPLYVSWEDHSAGFGNLILSASYDGGLTWSPSIQVNDNVNPNVDEFQPNLTAAADGTVLVAFYDRRLACPTGSEAVAAGLALDPNNPAGATNYCINASLQEYSAALQPIGHNIRLSRHTWDPELNSMKPYGIGNSTGFIGDYFGNITSGSLDFTTSVSTFDDGTNPGHFQQQVVATVRIP
ncbi:MAG TPA: sialidase family protein [Candidatus Baltobacterales bacterium]|nr:sialidase family protein [Candidatus Baltobacterales bacterium]